MIAPLFFALVALGAAGQAQSAPQAGTTPDVTVTARRPDQEKAVRHMTSVVTPVADVDRPLARFQTPICPQVDGLSVSLNRAFADRIRADAGIAKLPVDGQGCEANLTVLIVPDGKAVVRELERTHSSVFGDLDPVVIRHLIAQPGPAHLWTVTEIRSRDGDRINGGTLYTRTASIIQSIERIDVAGTVLLLDQQATVGKTVNQLADYAAMRTLAQTRPVGSAAATSTILTLFDADGAAPPRQLTEFDTAYLKALYHGSALDRPLTKVGIMSRAINKDLARESPTPR